jgi:hypothetical protein
VSSDVPVFDFLRLRSVGVRVLKTVSHFYFGAMKVKFLFYSCSMYVHTYFEIKEWTQFTYWRCCYVRLIRDPVETYRTYVIV